MVHPCLNVFAVQIIVRIVVISLRARYARCSGELDGASTQGVRGAWSGIVWKRSCTAQEHSTPPPDNITILKMADVGILIFRYYTKT